MQGLIQYLRFDWKSFFAAKTLSVVSCGPLNDYNTKQVIGSKINAVIIRDDTPYKPKSDGTKISNLYEKIAIKVPGKTLALAPGTVIELVDAVATVYGDYRNQLSVTAADIKIVQPDKA